MQGINGAELRRLLESIAISLTSNQGSQSSVVTQQSKTFNLNAAPRLIKFPPVSVEGLPAVTGGTHPSVIYHPRGFNGYKYWMLYTPYPEVRNENPCIVVSNDGESWITPSGLTNPIAPPPIAPNYYSDTELLMVSNTTMRAYWREYSADASVPSKLLFKESVNGVDWGDLQTCTIEGDRDPLSPCIIKMANGTYKLWVGQGSIGSKMDMYTSSDGITWTGQQRCVTNIGNNGYIWHPMIWATLTGYHCIAAIKNDNVIGTARLMTDLYYGKSKDGLDWVFDEQPVMMRGEYGMKNYRVYRSCAVQVASNKYKLYISGLGNESEQIHVVDADKIGELAAW